MRVLAINCGSSTLKFHLLDVEGEHAASTQGRQLAWGVVDRVGGRGSVRFVVREGGPVQEAAAVANHIEATRQVLGWVGSLRLLKGGGLDAAGHRVVHGGGYFAQPTLIDDQVLAAIEGASALAPLHNRPSLSAILAAREVLGPAVPQVATFDTAFHTSLPLWASRYAIPMELADKHRVLRYGFHGLAHRYMTERYATLTSTPLEQVRIITLQLGNGCSATAIAGGRSVDTSMGFTPLEGLMMGTRSGDLDPSLLAFLARREGVKAEKVEDWLNNRSGLLGISGRSGDMRELLEAEGEGDPRAALAVEMFCYRVRKYVGAYLAVVGGAQAIVFGGGIGENSPRVRARICAGMEWSGLVLDEERNALAIGSEAKISADRSTLQAYVLPVNEGVIIARDTLDCLQRRQA